MWANGDQSTNAQWWPMHYGYQYPVPDANTDWATRAAAWAQQRQAQEDMAKKHQDYYATAAQNQSKPVPTKPPLPNSDGTVRGFNNHSPDPPLPPGETPTLLSKVEHGTDNLETVAMDDEPLDTSIPEQGITVTRLDYNHGQPVPLPEVGPPPAIPGMQTFDHNHGYTPAPGTQTFGHVPAQRFDYGHQSAHSTSPTPPVSSHWYDYDTDRSKHSKHFDTDRPSSRHSSRSVEPVTTQFDFASLSDIKKKALPLWIREGLEKMEREKQKKQEHDLKKSLNSSTSSLPTIAGYDHGNVHSPVPSPEHPVQSDEEPDKSDEEKEEDIKPPKKSKSSKHHWSPKSPSKSDSSDEEVNYKSDTEKQQELLVRMRKMLTEILLSVTNDELHNIAKESYNEALTAENKQLRSSGGLDLIKIGGALGVGDYGSDSESSEEDEEQPEQRQQPVNDRDENHLHGADDDESKRYSRSRSRSQENDKSHSNSPVHKHKQTEPGSSASSDQESEPSESSRKKKHSKHKQKDRRDSPKGRSKHKSRRSRSRSRTPKKHKSRRKDPSRSRSPSGSRSARKSKNHSRSTSRSPSRKHRKVSQSSSRSPSSRKHRKASRSSSRSPSSRKHRRKSRSSSRSPSRRRSKRSESESPHRYHRQHSRSLSSDQHKAGKRGNKQRSRSRSRSSSPRHRRH